MDNLKPSGAVAVDVVPTENISFRRVGDSDPGASIVADDIVRIGWGAVAPVQNQVSVRHAETSPAVAGDGDVTIQSKRSPLRRNPAARAVLYGEVENVRYRIEGHYALRAAIGDAAIGDE